MNDPIDMVYTWCSDADARWREKRIACARRLGVRISGQENGECRYRDNDDIRYSLRSLAAHAGWIRRIFIAVDDDAELPAWMDLSNPRLSVVRHSQFMPRESLPCFCSDTIELFLHCIPGLAERFLYANDDMMFFRRAEPSFFYAEDGYPYCRYGGLKHAGDLSRFTVYRTNLMNSAKLLLGDYGENAELVKACSRYPHHGIDAYLKSDMRACFEKYRSVLEPTIEFPFREISKYQRFLYLGYAIAEGHGHFKVARAHAAVRRAWWKRLIVHGWADSLQFVGRNWRVVERELNRYKPTLFCCNDTEETTAEDIAEMKATYERLFPDMSEFEKGGAA